MKPTAFPARLRLLALPLALVAVSAAAQPGDYPNRPIRIIVPFTAGGSSDVQGRMLGEQLAKLYKQPVIVENKPGAGGHIGGKAVVDAPADGYTLMLGSIGLHATYAVYKKLTYNPGSDFKIVTVLAEMPHVVVANPGIAAADLKQLAAQARREPGAINFGSAGVGSSVHMMGELFKIAADAPLTHIPYRGSSPALADLIGGQIQLMFENPPTTFAHIKTGKLKALAVTGKERLPALPQVPTAAEAGFPSYAATSWTTVAVAASVPDAIADKLNADIRKIVATPEFRQGLQEQGMTPVANTRAEAAKFVAAEKQRWEKVIQQAKLIAD
ncbi:tripartite tricarboxylate transporter substrate binding protein [Roseateles sp. DAIF2]|uniref:Bug family tripartite tricarboxylate transporter substrate binding protein n=1 Tax=Roseateles sp. DAIF2 TaxID=2714952 RepID=UPI0018A30D6E|nr:tripartite tricarboxylate transporter substrate binding protein [Roseateles sp. DAIF2]QPF74378.1 tripartite tricarboxylate transporter substrate binding protein [Roseateles sp. DAIF2]